jgi:hypothetical protein
MGWYFRKAIGLGPFRLNLSKSGIGWSVGGRGFRYGHSATGQRYIHAGRGGLYLRQNLGPIAQPAGATSQGQVAPSSGPPVVAPVPSHEVAALVTRAQRLWRWDLTIAAIASLALLVTLAVEERDLSMWAVPAIGFVVLVWYAAYRWEVHRRVVTLCFESITPAEQRRFAAVDSAVRSLAGADQLWAVNGATSISGQVSLKGNAGAASLVARTPLEVSDREPAWVQTTLQSPSLRTKAWHLTFLPHGVLAVAGKVAAFTPYARLSVHGQSAQFIEGSPPRDAKVVGHTWQFMNKSGGPDRRYTQNRQLAVCEYGQIELRSPDLRVTFQVSSLSTAQSFVRDILQVLSQVRGTP